MIENLLHTNMNGKGFLLAGSILFLACASAVAQKDWELKVDKEDIKVYTKNMDNSALKAIKITCSINASLAGLTAVLLDIPGSIDWVYATKKVTVLKPVSPAEVIYYSELNVPWPVSNRDFIVDLKVTQDEKTKIVTVIGYNKPAYLPVYKNIVRIQQSYSKWVIYPMPNAQVRIEYVLQADPGGSVPAWLINMFATKGPFETFKKLREQVKKPAFGHISLPFIKD